MDRQKYLTDVVEAMVYSLILRHKGVNKAVEGLRYADAHRDALLARSMGVIKTFVENNSDSDTSVTFIDEFPSFIPTGDDMLLTQVTAVVQDDERDISQFKFILFFSAETNTIAVATGQGVSRAYE